MESKFTSKGLIHRPEYMHTDYFEYWLRDFTSDGSVLNHACGMSTIGDVRVDMDPKTNRTMEGNLLDIGKDFRENSFDYVYVDPIYDMFYNPSSIIFKPDIMANPQAQLQIMKLKQQIKELENQVEKLNVQQNPLGNLAYKWQFDAFKIARKALITRRPKININMPSRWHEWLITEDSRPSINLVRIDYK